MRLGLLRALVAAAVSQVAAARDDAAIVAAVRASRNRMKENIRMQNWLGIADYSPNDRVEVGVKADGSGMGGFKGGVLEAAAFANFLGATIPRTPPGAYMWHEDKFLASVESERIVHVLSYGHSVGNLSQAIDCGLFRLPDHKGFSTYSRYRLDLDGRWRIQLTLFPVGNAAAQFPLAGGSRPASPCPPSPRSPFLGNAPMYPGTEDLVQAVRPTSDEQSGFAPTTGFGIGTAEQSEQAKLAAAVRSARLSDALRDGSSDVARRFFSMTAAVVPEGADRFISVDELLARASKTLVTPMRATWAFDEQDGVVHEVGLGGFAERYYTRWEQQDGSWKVTLHVFPVGPPTTAAGAEELPARGADLGSLGSEKSSAGAVLTTGLGAYLFGGVMAGMAALRLVLARAKVLSAFDGEDTRAASDFARLDA